MTPTPLTERTLAVCPLKFTTSPPPRLLRVPPTRDCRICVTIPARDEAESIADTVEAFARQRELEGGAFDRSRFEIILLANNCLDDTAGIARRAAARFPGLVMHVVETDFSDGEAHVGAARRRLMDEAHHRLQTVRGRSRGIIATTDADTIVAPDWLAMTEREIARGAGAVGGNIRPCPRGLAELVPGARRLERQNTRYQLLAAHLEHLVDPDPADPWPRHYHHFGGSFAVTAEDYARVGGLPPLPALEDVAFYEALRRHDVPFRHSPAVRVRTSARCFGRAPHGLSATLRRWSETSADNSPAVHLVESTEALEARVRLRRDLRELWQTRHRAHETDWRAGAAVTAGVLGLGAAEIVGRLATATTFGAIYEQLCRAGSPAHASFPWVEVDEALSVLRARVQALRARRPGHLASSLAA